MATRIIYPKGIASGANNDTDRLQAAIMGGTVDLGGGAGSQVLAALADDDVLLMKARKLADYPSGAITPWILNRPRGTDTPYGKSSLTSTYDMMSWMPETTGMPVVITDKRVTLKGETENNAPITMIKGFTSKEAWVTNFETYAALTGMLLPTGNKTVRFEDLSFQYHCPLYYTINQWGPAIEVINCKFDCCDYAVGGIRDQTYAGFTTIMGCNFTNCTGITIYGRGMIGGLIKNCTFGGTDFDSDYAWFGYAMIFNCFSSANTPDMEIPCTKLNNVLVSDCEFVYTGSHHNPEGVVSSGNGVGGTVENIAVADCQFTDVFTPGWAIIELCAAYEDGYGVQGTTKKCSATGNTFLRCGGRYGTIFADGTQYYNGTDWVYIPVTECLYSDNTFVDSIVTDGTHNRGTRSSLRLSVGESCQLVKNEFKDSNMQTVAVCYPRTAASCIYLESSAFCTVYEKDREFPIPSEGVEGYLLDAGGYQNTVTGRNIPHMSKPKDLGLINQDRGLSLIVRASRDYKDTMLKNKTYPWTPRPVVPEGL